MNSVERVMYTTSNTPSEAASISSLVPNVEPLVSNPSLQPKNDTELLGSGWPWQGGVTFSNGVMRYREDFQPVLQGVNVAINPGESIGIVGRTGSGKSSLFRALLRLTELEHGNILIDGVDIRSIGLDTLRSSIAIIPQDPVLFSGSIRCEQQSASPFVSLSQHVHLLQPQSPSPPPITTQAEPGPVQHQGRRSAVGSAPAGQFGLLHTLTPRWFRFSAFGKWRKFLSGTTPTHVSRPRPHSKKQNRAP